MLAAYWSLEARTPLKMSGIVGGIMFISILFHGARFFSPEFSLTFNQFAQDFIATLIGSIGLTLLVSLLLYSYDEISKISGNSIEGYSTAACFLIIASTIFHAAVYFSLFFFLQPLAVNIRGNLAVPFEGAYAVERETEKRRTGPKNIDNLDWEKSFSFLPQETRHAKISMQGADGSTTMNWENFGSNVRYDLTVYFLVDCFSFSRALENYKEKPGLVFTDVQDLKIEWDSGNLAIESTEFQDSRLRFYHPQPTYFWVFEIEDDEKPLLAVQNFFGDKSQLIGRIGGPQKFFFRAPLQTFDSDGSSPSPRFMKLSVNRETYTYRFSPLITDAPGWSSRKLSCSATSAPSASEQQANGFGSIASLIFELEPRFEDPQRWSSYDSKLSVEGLRGWATVKNIQPDAFQQQHIGNSDFVVLHNLESVALEGDEVPTDPDTSIVIVGGTYIAPSRDGGVRFSSQSDRVWIDNKRVNRSYWESLPVEMKFAVIGWIGAIVWLFRNPLQAFFSVLRRGEELRFIPRN